MAHIPQDDGSAPDVIRVLVVEDNPGDALLLEEYLDSASSTRYELTHVERLEEAIETLCQHEFDVALLDLGLPDSSGLDSLLRIREQTDSVPIVVLTGNDDEAISIGAMQAGAQDYLVKNELSTSMLLRSIRYAIERHRMMTAMEHLAYYDAVTRLPNRQLFYDHLRQSIAQARRRGRAVAVVILDLDGFKYINDTFGHSVGDELLRIVGEYLKSGIRESDTASRLGGDEFSLILSDLQRSHDAAEVAHKILTGIPRPCRVDGHELFVTASAGISLFPEDGDDVETLLRNADIAMFRAKRQGRNNYQLYNLSLDAVASERLKLENRLRRALDNGELVAYYQPQVDLLTGRITGVEALVRWQHPEEGLIPPGQFIPLAEETGLVVPLGDWMLRTACEHNRQWAETGLPPITVGVNLSPRQFRDEHLLDKVAAVLSDTCIDPARLELEITESNAMHDVDYTVRILNGLKEMGVKLAVDDFGTGYSSLAYLKRFPLDRLKIDRSFAIGVATNRDDAAITTAIIALAHGLQLNVIAEGVETQDQIQFLRTLHCNQIQGYYFSRPVELDAFVELLRQGGYSVGT